MGSDHDEKWYLRRDKYPWSSVHPPLYFRLRSGSNRWLNERLGSGLQKWRDSESTRKIKFSHSVGEGGLHPLPGEPVVTRIRTPLEDTVTECLVTSPWSTVRTNRPRNLWPEGRNVSDRRDASTLTRLVWNNHGWDCGVGLVPGDSYTHFGEFRGPGGRR